jgi:hypothetical protein
MSFTLINEINEEAEWLRQVVTDYGYENIDQMCEGLLAEANGEGQAMARAGERDWAQQAAAASGEAGIEKDRQDMIARRVGVRDKIQAGQVIKWPINVDGKRTYKILIIRGKGDMEGELDTFPAKNKNQKFPVLIDHLKKNFKGEKTQSGKTMWVPKT